MSINLKNMRQLFLVVGSQSPVVEPSLVEVADSCELYQCPEHEEETDSEVNI